MSVANDYVNAIMYRRNKPLEPVGFKTDWADQPYRHKVYQTATLIPLPGDGYRPPGGLHAAMAGVPEAGGTGVGVPDAGGTGAGGFTLPMLGALLRDSYGPLGRRLGVHGNSDLRVLPWYYNATWSRGTSSGGGLYPLEIYWVSGPSGPLLPGVYHYSTPHQALHRLLTGDVVDRVRAALHDADVAASTDQFLLVSIKFWKNAFKYNSFCYHAVTVDVGTLLSTWQYWARAAGVELRPLLWFDEPALDRLLGLSTEAESVFAVVPLRFAGAAAGAALDRTTGHPDRAPGASGNGRGASGNGPGAPAVWLRETERSRTVIRFPTVEAVHAATVPVTWPRPKPAALAPARPATPDHPEAEWQPLPPPDELPGDVPDTLRARRSSFGRLVCRPELSRVDLGSVLAAGTAGGRLCSDVKDTAGEPALTRMVAFVNHVTGLPAGIYDYHPGRHALALRERAELGMFLQRNYLLTNYNLEQAAAVLAVLAKPEAAIEAAGERGYRIVNAEVGAVTQAVYLACAARGLGCGAALGIDSLSYAERLDLVGTGEWPILIMMLGHERSGGPHFDYRIA